MKVKLKEKPCRNKRHWHRWFAWYPVVAVDENFNDVFVWLEYIFQRHHCWSTGELMSKWRYTKEAANNSNARWTKYQCQFKYNAHNL